MAVVTLFGGTGFLGRVLARRLAEAGWTVRIAVRRPERGGAGAVFADVRDPGSVAAALEGADAVVNAVSLYLETGGATFEAIHEKGAETVAEAAVAADVRRLVQLSGIGADPNSPAPYIRARGRGEARVRAAFPGAAVVRPSAMFGPGDALFSIAAGLARLSPVLPLIGGAIRLQPVFVDDVAAGIVRLLADPPPPGRTYEFGGPQVMTLREAFELALTASGRRRLLLPLPFPLARLAARVLERTPWPLLTVGQVDLLARDNVADAGLPGLAELGVEPASAADVVPGYLGAHRGAGP